ncbi:MAG: response regulator [Armatimonadota bacterium]
MAHILLVEDDDLVANLLTKVLRRTGHTLLTARDGEEALELCRSATHELGLVITDIVMPGLSGPEWVEAAGGALDEVPVTYISGYSDDARAPHGLLVKDAELLTKPFQMDQLLDLVERRVGR